MTDKSLYNSSVKPVSSGTGRKFAPGKIPGERPGPTGGKRDLNRAQRAHDLCVAALGLFQERGVEAVTVDEITRAAQVAKGSFYRYFADKAQLVDALFAPMAAELAVAFERCAASLSAAQSATELMASYEVLAQALVATFFDKPELVVLYLRECRSSAEGARRPIRALSDEVVRQAIDLTTAAHRHGLLRDLPPNVTALAVIGAVETLMFRFLDARDIGDPAVATSALITMVLDGLRRDISAP